MTTDRSAWITGNRSANASWSITVGRRTAVMAALRILLAVAMAGSRRDATITFEIGQDVR